MATSGVPHFDQPSFGPSSNGDETTVENMSHVPTTAASALKSGSLYSYNSTRDVTRYVREIYGRYAYI